MTQPSRVSAATPTDGGPEHLAIIMDGNGRWATRRARPRCDGHRQGVETLRRTVRACRDLGLHHLTIFSFSTENWGRPRAEIEYLFDLLRLYARRNLNELVDQGVRVRIVGARTGLSANLLSLIDTVEDRTCGNDSFHLNIAFNYGGRA